MKKRTSLRFYKLMTQKELEQEKNQFHDGCGNKVDSGGDCMYFSNQGSKRYCSTCRRHLKEINKQIIKDEE